MEHQFTATTPQQVLVELQSGDLRVAAVPGDTVRVGISGDDAERVQVTQEGTQIRVVGPRGGFFSRSASLVLTLTVPEGTDLETRLGSAGVSASGVLGAVDVVTGSGAVDLATVTGRASVKTGSGGISITEAAAETDLKTGSGNIRVGHLARQGSLKTGSGSIEVGRAEASVSLKSGSGDLVVREAETDTSLATASGDLRIGRIARGQAQLKNASGSIHLGVAAGTPVWTDVSSATGHVRSHLVPTGEPTEGQDFVAVRASSVTGDIYLTHV